jgi:hypothetical protein
MLSITTQILNEKVTQPLLDVILRNLVKDDKVHYSFVCFFLFFFACLLKGCLSKAYSYQWSGQIFMHVGTYVTHS